MFTLIILSALLPLLDDRPVLADVLRFPHVEVIDAQLAANRAYHCLLTHRRAVELDRASALQAALDETHFSWWAWDWLRHAAANPGTDYGRNSLSELRAWIGPEAFYAAKMPPCVPQQER